MSIGVEGLLINNDKENESARTPEKFEQNAISYRAALAVA